MAAGADATAVLAADGLCFVMGRNRFGTLGTGDFADRGVPQLLPPPNGASVTAIAMGAAHFAAQAGGRWFIVGDNFHGQLGLGHHTDAATPQPVPQPPEARPITALVLGFDATAILTDGQCLVMGRNTAGQLGLGDLLNRNAPQRLAAPNAVPITAIAFGRRHTVLLAGGECFVMGANAHGQLGLGDRVPRHTPHLLPSPSAGFPITAIVAGEDTTAVSPGGVWYAMGLNGRGQLGLQDRVNRGAPHRLDPPNDAMIYSLAFGRSHSMFLSTRTPTPTVTASVTPLPTTTGTNTGSSTPTPSLSATPSPTASPSPTTTSSPTGTPSPSTSGTPSRSVTLTPTPTPSFTASPTASATSSRTSTHTTSPTATSTPSITTTPRPTASPSQTWSCSTTCTRTCTPSSTYPLTPTISFTASPTATASSTPTPSATASPRPSRTTTPTPSSTWTPSCTTSTSISAPLTPTPSLTTTALPTGTASASATAELAPCSNGTASAVAGAVTLQAGATQCFESVTLGTGSTAFQSKKISIVIVALDGTATIRLDSGCQQEGGGCPACDACTRSYSPVDVGRKDALPVGSQDLQLSVMYHPPTTAVRRQRQPTAAAFAAEVVVEFTASSLIVIFLAVVTFGSMPCVIVLGRWHAKRMAASPVPRDHWATPSWGRPRHPRWSNPWIEAALALGVHLIVFGVVWYVLLMAMRHSNVPGSFAEVFGLVLAAVGLVLLGIFGLLAAREDSPHDCPACGRPTSNWRFIGTSLPPAYTPHPTLQPTVRQKGHTRCVRCVQCGKPVVLDRWAHAPPDRPYHGSCWEAHCRAVCSDPQYAPTWAEARGGTDYELACMLEATVQEGCEASMRTLLAMRPDIDVHPLPGAPSARHSAAMAKNLPALQTLLERKSGLPDVFCRERDWATVDSLLITSLGRGTNDLYVRQAPLTYNGRQVYIGHSTGQYIYYYEPSAKERHAAGWCLSTYLGCGSPKTRICLDPPCAMPPPDDAETDACAGGKPAPGLRGDATRPRHVRIVHGLMSVVRGMVRKTASRKTASNSLHPSEAVPTAQHDAARVHGNEAADGPTKDPTAVTLLSPEGMGLKKVPHAICLMQAAARSGDTAMVRYVMQQYQAHYPQSLVWQHHIGNGLWNTYPHILQQQVGQALKAGQDHITVDYENRTVVLDLQARQHHVGGYVSSMRCQLQTMVQYPVQGSEWAVTSCPDTNLNWDEAAVLFDPGSIATSAPDRQTLAVLSEEGVIDPSLWQPASHDPEARAWESQTNAQQQLFQNVLQDFLASAFAVPDGAAGLGWDAPLGATRPRDRGRTNRQMAESRFTDGLQAPSSASRGAFYDVKYRSDVGTLAFSMALPENELGLVFTLPPLVQMCSDAVMKVHELRRQRVTLSPLYIVPIYVYTYELDYPPDGGTGEQVYGAMNRAMRLSDEQAIDFWRPLIWQVDRSLQMLPPYTGKLYRGINVRFDEHSYCKGQEVCWPAFSSASATQAVAEEFVKGDEGSLFFLHSASARAISRFSKFPNEGEVLFRPNTIFEITLYGTSDIGQFYASVDNIAMVERPECPPKGGCTAPVPGLPSSAAMPALSHLHVSEADAAAAHIILTVDSGLQHMVLDHVESLHFACVDYVEMHQEEQSFVAHMAVRANPHWPPLPPAGCLLTPGTPDIPEPQRWRDPDSNVGSDTSHGSHGPQCTPLGSPTEISTVGAADLPRSDSGSVFCGNCVVSVGPQSPLQTPQTVGTANLPQFSDLRQDARGAGSSDGPDTAAGGGGISQVKIMLNKF